MSKMVVKSSRTLLAVTDDNGEETGAVIMVARKQRVLRNKSKNPIKSVRRGWEEEDEYTNEQESKPIVVTDSYQTVKVVGLPFLAAIWDTDGPASIEEAAVKGVKEIRADLEKTLSQLPKF